MVGKSVPACLAGVGAGCIHLCRVEGNTVTLCDPIWQVTLRSCVSVMEFSINGLQYLYLLPFTATYWLKIAYFFLHFSYSTPSLPMFHFEFRGEVKHEETTESWVKVA